MTGSPIVPVSVSFVEQKPVESPTAPVLLENRRGWVASPDVPRGAVLLDQRLGWVSIVSMVPRSVGDDWFPNVWTSEASPEHSTVPFWTRTTFSSLLLETYT